MTWQGWAEIVFTISLSTLLGWPLGLYIARVWRGERTWLSPVLRPVETLFYRLAGVDPAEEQDWRSYTISLLAFSAAGFGFLYLVLRSQQLLPLTPKGFTGMNPHLAFNTAMSFVTNTDWQFYSGESTLGPFAQMTGLTVQNFLSAGVGMAVAAALARAFATNRGRSMGNFWIDLTRNTLYVLLPLSVVLALVLVGLGVPQTLTTHQDAVTLEGVNQTLALGPVASQEAIKQLGTNGGGFFNANAAHPFENPSPATNVLEILAMLVIPFGCVFAFGAVAAAKREALALVAAMVVLVGGGASAIYAAETSGVPAQSHAGVAASVNMEGKETRFGAPSSALFASVTTGVSDGAVNSAHESFTPLGGGVAMFLIQLGELAPGGVGSGLYGMVHMAILAVFVAGLMVGRTPEYLGKKIEAREVKFVMLSALIMTFSILAFSALALVLPVALKGLQESGVHGLSEALYAYTSATGNNGSAFAGLSGNSDWWDTTMGLAMAFGRYGYIIPVMAVAGSLAAKPKLEPTAGTLSAHSGLFVGLLIGVIVILGGLQFFPALALGPIVEHFQMLGALSS